MTNRDPSIEANLQIATTQWKILQLTTVTLALASVAYGFAVVLGVGMLRGWVVERSTVGALCSLFFFIAIIAWIILLMRAFAKVPDRKQVAGALEGADSRLMDRLNTLVFLEKNRRSDPARWFFSRITKQARSVLVTQAPARAFSPNPAAIQLGIFLVMLVGTYSLYRHYSPWQKLISSAEARRNAAVPEQKVPELALPTNNLAEENKVWGEVRITDPARDLKVTKVDVVPLQIEAAANQSLQKVGWSSTVNGGVEKTHDLPPPAEPRYAVYQPMLYLDEYRLADWDVMTYYANARTKQGEGYGSEVYFLEVRPFREDILKLPGGEGGKAYEALSEMTSLIERQQHVIRETHHYQQATQPDAKLREQDRRKLSEGEDDLAESARHLYADMATKMENKPIGEALDHLAQADRFLGTAAKALEADTIPPAQNHERSALAELIAARKMFQKAVSDHPGDFSDDKKKPDDEPTPIADSSQKLSEIAEFRNEAKAAQDFVQKAVEQQKNLAKSTASTPRSEQAHLAEEEKKLEKSLEDFREQHPKAFQDVTNEMTAAEQSLERAANSLEKKGADARAKTELASGSLQTLSSSMQHTAAGHELADAYRLKQLLDDQIQKLDQLQKSTNAPSPADLQKAAGDSRETLEQLRQVAENKPTSDAFGPQLKQSLTGTNQSALDAELNQLAQAQNKSEGQQAAGDAKTGLSKVSQAFTQSQPSAMQAAKKRDSLKPGDQEAFDQGMAELESVKQQMENGHKLSSAQESKLKQDALANLSQGVMDLYGSNEQAKDILLALQEDLKDRGDKLDLALLKKLMDQLRNFSIEVADKRNKNDKPELTNVDPSRLPPAYRGRIEKYYQKLSEQKP